MGRFARVLAVYSHDSANGCSCTYTVDLSRQPVSLWTLALCQPAAGLGKDRPQDGRIPREGCKDLEEGASRRAVRRDDDVVVSKKVWKGAKGKLFNQLLANPIPFLAQVPESIMEYVRAGWRARAVHLWAGSHCVRGVGGQQNASTQAS